MASHCRMSKTIHHHEDVRAENFVRATAWATSTEEPVATAAGIASSAAYSRATSSGYLVPLACASARPTRYVAAIWARKHLVDATPISGPAWV